MHGLRMGKGCMDAFSDVLSSVYTDSALKHAIEVLDAGDAAVSDRNVRSVAERRALDEAGAVLAQMKPLATNLQTLGRAARKQGRVYDEMTRIASQAHSAVAVYAAEAQFLAEEQQKGARQINTLRAFMARVYLNESEKALLGDAASVLTPEFLAAFLRAREIHREAAPIVLAEFPRAGELLMHETGELLDSAYLKIQRAIEIELKHRGATAEASGETSGTLRQYMMLLADRPLLFKAVLENQSGTRKARLGHEFATMLTKEQGAASFAPVRFLGSVLAWIHATVVNELEHISLLLDPGEQDASLASSHLISSLLSTSNPHQIVTELVDQVVGSLEPSIRQHLNALVVAQSDPAVLDEMQSVLLFYQKTVLAKYEQPKLNALFSQLSENMSNQFARLLPAGWEARVALSAQLLRTYEQGVYVDPDFFSSRLDAVLDPILQNELAPQDPIGCLNTLDTAVSQLAGYVIAQPKLDHYRQLESEFVAKQVAKEVATMCTESKLTEFQVNAISLREFMSSMDAFLAGGGGQDLVIRLDRLSSPTTAHHIANAAIDEFVSQYEFATRDTSARPVDEVRSLLL